MACNEFRAWLDDYLDDALEVGRRRAIDVHLAGCRDCAVDLAGRQALRRALRELPVPEPHPEFVDRALRVATGAFPGTARLAALGRRWRWALKRHVDRRFGMIGAAAALATLAGAALLVVHLREPAVAPPKGFTLALEEVREVGVMIDSERELETVTITITVAGGVGLAGFDEQHELRWQSRLNQGNNLLSLPVVGRAPGAGRLVALVESEGRSRQMAIEFEVRDRPRSPNSDAGRPGAGLRAAG